MTSNITGYTKILGIIAHPIKHSLSPMMHNAACQKLGLDYVYVAFDVTEDRFEEAIQGIKALGVQGLNVSMPYKTKVIPYLDSITLQAKLCGAVNTITYEQGTYIGDNTDGRGFMESLYDKGWNPKGKKMIIFGAGGSALAIMVQAVLEGVKEVIVYKRKNGTYQKIVDTIHAINQELHSKIVLKPLEDLEELKRDLQDSYIVVNATSVGMGSLEDMSCVPDVSYFPNHIKVADIIYNPQETKFIQQAKQAGLEYMNGQRMLLFQGALSFEQWTKQKMPISHMKKILNIT